MSQPPLTNLNQQRFEKILPHHLDRLAVVYVRQSTMQQVAEHQESTRLQYGLVERALAFGWPKERILVIDDDLGKSASSTEGRLGFQQLVAEVSLDHVGLILGVDISRLARSSKDWHQLLEICALFKTLISDLDGIYDPSQYNDRLLLGLKGTMSEAELHVIKQRLYQGVLSKARRGELRLRLPSGYIYSPSGSIIFDPDEQVQLVIRLIFQKFEEFHTVGSLLKYLVQHDIQLGMRHYSAELKGHLDWHPPNRATLLYLLKHPIYAGAYSYGRRQVDRKKQQPGRPATGRAVLPLQQWHVLLHDRLPAYISWEQFQRNQAQLQSNQARSAQPGAVRQGIALLQGLLVCQKCGNRFATRYCDSQTFSYHCSALRSNYAASSCQHLAGPALDAFITDQVLNALQPAALELSLQAASQLQQERHQLHQLWLSRIERATFDADRAARHYQLIEPENRLVARQLARDWETKLLALHQLQEDYQRFLQQQPASLSPQQLHQIRQLALDIPSLWAAPTTTAAHRKDIIRQLVDRISIDVQGQSERVHLSIHWQGGSITPLSFQRPVAKFTQLSYYPQLCQCILHYKDQGLSAAAIAQRLNQDGFRPPKRSQVFSEASVQALCRTLNLTQPISVPLPIDALKPHEWWLTDLAHTLHMPTATLYRWLRKGLLQARQISSPTARWIIWADPAELDRLHQYRHRSLPEEQRQRWLDRHLQPPTDSLTSD
jgi:DNA invertase Pin-like site-specific DNA recombinase